MLELSTVVPREKIKIDGIQYDMLNADEFELKDYLKLQREASQFENLEDKDFTPKKVNELMKAYDVLLEKILLAPKKVRKRLSGTQKIQIIAFFLEARKRAVQNISNSSPDFKDSTGETRKPG